MKAIETQVGGAHYNRMRFQPVELTYMLGETSGFQNVAKYLTRDKGDSREDWMKAIHFIELEREMHGRGMPVRFLRGDAGSARRNGEDGLVLSRIGRFASQFVEPIGACVYPTLALLRVGKYQEAIDCIQWGLSILDEVTWPADKLKADNAISGLNREIPNEKRI